MSERLPNRLSEVLNYEYTDSYKAIDRVLYVINEQWDVDATEDDLESVVKIHRSPSGLSYTSIYFDAKQTLIDKLLIEHPEALI